MSVTQYKGQCFCGAVEIAAKGQPFAMGYCHCKDCREWSSGPFTVFTLWKPDDIEVVKGEDSLGNFARSEASQRKFCVHCGGRVLSNHPAANFTDVYAATLPTLDFEPTVHVNYASAVMQIKDGLPKLKDFPKEMGGSGELMPE